MEFSSILIVIFIFILSGIFILRPFFVETKTESKKGSSRTDSLMAEKERLLLAIEDLGLEFDLQKISSEEYTRNRDILFIEAAEVLKELDKVQKTGSKKKKIAPTLKVDDDLEKMISDRRQQLKAKKLIECPSCGKPVDKEAKFCSYCGKAL